jgi:hypothetical protein
MGWTADEQLGVVRADVLVISHDCAIEKHIHQADEHVRERWPVLVAPLVPASYLGADNAGNARHGKMKQFYWLPAHDGHDETFADLYRIQWVPIYAVRACERRATLSDTSNQRLALHILVMLSERQLRDILPAPSPPQENE